MPFILLLSTGATFGAIISCFTSTDGVHRTEGEWGFNVYVKAQRKVMFIPVSILTGGQESMFKNRMNFFSSHLQGSKYFYA